MITGESFEKVINESDLNIAVEYISGKNPYWSLYITDPDECDERLLLGKLDEETLIVSVPDLSYDGDLADWFYNGGSDTFEDRYMKNEIQDLLGNGEYVKAIYCMINEKELLHCLLEYMSDDLGYLIDHYKFIKDCMIEDIGEITQ